MSDSIVIVSAARTPIGGLLGDFSSLAAHQLGAIAIKAAVARAGITGDAVNEALMGNCLMAGQGQAPARQAVLGAGLPQSVGAVTLSSPKGETVIKFDEQPFKAKLDKIPGLKPAFKKDGTITAATSSSISDGAAALVMMRESTAAKLGVTPIARIHAHAVHAQAPNWFTTAPVGAIEKALKRAGWNAKDVDLWEVNEAFAAVTLAAMTEFKLPHEIVNVNGGAVALGHPIGASGARIVVTLLGALRQRGRKKGVAALCIGGGEATALALELV